jgi:arsenite/tail-anchored protein-transporting ATPase
MRIILYTGKGGVGKTSVAAATGLTCARRGHRTLVMSLDTAHSLSDSFDLPGSLVDHARGAPVNVEKNLDIQEVDVLEEVHRHWREIHGYLGTLLAHSGVDEALSDELAILPGMEEASCLLYINKYAREKTYDVIILDCAPTGESLRFISFPSILKWYMDKLFSLERTIAKVARPVVKHLTSIPLPGDEYFENLRELFGKIEGVDRYLTDPKICSVRLVTNPEKMVLKETQRAYVYFCLYGLLVDGVIINRILPQDLKDQFFDNWKQTQRRSLKQIEESFAPVPLLPVPLFDNEVLGIPGLERLSATLYPKKDPAAVFYSARPLTFKKTRGVYTMTMALPFVSTEDLDLTRVEDSLVVRLGAFRRHVPLPRGIPPDAPISAELSGEDLKVKFG